LTAQRTTRIRVSGKDLALLKAKLAPILTVTDRDIEEEARAAPLECTRIAGVLRTFHGGMREARQWLASTMVSVPASCWVPMQGHGVVLSADGASLKHCTPGDFLIKFQKEPQFRARELLCRALAELLEGEQRERYGAMAKWSTLEVPDPQRHEFLLDVMLADSIYRLEHTFYVNFAQLERQVRQRHALASERPTPPQAIVQLADAARKEFLRNIARVTDHAEGKDSLVVRVLANIAANRFLLESAQQAAHAEQAANIAVELLQALNGRGFCLVPPVNSDRDIASVLRGLFSAKHGLLRDEPAFKHRHDAATDAGLAYTLELAGLVQEHYTLRRGGHSDPQLADAQFGGYHNKLIFALAVTACAHAGARVDEELFGQNEREHPAYPGRGKREGRASENAMDLFCAVFGHIAFSNVGWALRADGVREYSQALAYKRACVQDLVFNTFKRTTAPQLLALYVAENAARGL
jgi:hypothetical protein